MNATKYYRERYQNDPSYRERIKLYNRKRYHRLTINCTKCHKRWNIQNLQDSHFKYDNQNFNCPNCLPENNMTQNKLLKQGRPKKYISS